MATRDKNFRKQLSLLRVKEYFYGSPGRNDLAPFSMTLSFNDILVRVISEGVFFYILIVEFKGGLTEEYILGSLVPSSALPLGMEATLSSDLKFKKIEPGDLLLHSVLAVSTAMPPSEVGQVWNSDQETKALISSPIAGFIYW